jgi:hypothetical protein
MNHFLALCLLGGFVVCSQAANSQTLTSPIGEPILTISGAITQTNVEGTAQFDRDMLEALGTVSITTKTPWHDGEVVFEGVSLDALMKRVGATGSMVTAVALNDYVTTIPLEDFARFKPILALKKDGAYLSVRDLGPLFIIYPYDSDPDLQTQTFFARSAWQVVQMTVK